MLLELLSSLTGYGCSAPQMTSMNMIDIDQLPFKHGNMQLMIIIVDFIEFLLCAHQCGQCWKFSNKLFSPEGLESGRTDGH